MQIQKWETRNLLASTGNIQLLCEENGALKLQLRIHDGLFLKSNMPFTLPSKITLSIAYQFQLFKLILCISYWFQINPSNIHKQAPCIGITRGMGRAGIHRGEDFVLDVLGLPHENCQGKISLINFHQSQIVKTPSTQRCTQMCLLPLCRFQSYTCNATFVCLSIYS